MVYSRHLRILFLLLDENKNETELKISDKCMDELRKMSRCVIII